MLVSVYMRKGRWRLYTSKMRFNKYSTHFLKMLRRVLILELSSGAFSAMVVVGGALLEVVVDSVEGAVEGATDEELEEGPDEADAIKYVGAQCR